MLYFTTHAMPLVQSDYSAETKCWIITYTKLLLSELCSVNPHNQKSQFDIIIPHILHEILAYPTTHWEFN